MEWLKPTKKSITTFAVAVVLYLFFLYTQTRYCTQALLLCSDKPNHNVPNIFPGSSSCQVCATNSELVMGYFIMIITAFVLPIIIIYLVSSLLNLLKRNTK